MMPNDTAPAWDGVPLNADRDGWHWLCYLNAPEITFAKAWRSLSADHGLWADTSGHRESGPSLVCLNYRYLGPCLTPSKQSACEAAAVAAGAMEMREKSLKIADDAIPTARPPQTDHYGAHVAGERHAAERIVQRISAIPIGTTALDRLLAEAREEGFKLASDVALAALSPSDGAMYSADFKAQLASHHTMERVKARLEEAADGYGFCARSTPA